MKHVFAATCLAFAGAITLAAQTPPAQDQPKAKAQAQSEGKTVAVTGCLRTGDEPGTFVLANVKTDAAKGEKPTGTTGTAAIGPDSTLRLIGAPANLDLKAHVGHTVQLTGMLSPAGTKDRTSGAGAGTTGTGATGTTPTTPPAGSPGGTTAQRDTQRSATDMQSFNVKSMKHVSEKCPM